MAAIPVGRRAAAQVVRVPATRAGRRAAARAGCLAVAVIGVVALAGCGSSGSSTSSAPPSTQPSSSSPAPPASSSAPAPAPSGSSQSPAVTAPPACATSSLQVNLGLGQGYAGGVYQNIVFTNISSASCTLYGYPGVSLVSGPPYTQIGLAAKRNATTPVKLITLAPGATANALLQIVDALNYPTASCGPTKATALASTRPTRRPPSTCPPPRRLRQARADLVHQCRRRPAQAAPPDPWRLCSGPADLTAAVPHAAGCLVRPRR